ncbi:centromere protein W-like [Saccoglossus kowalevskii]|uniref:Centromere protein W-like n=1 Tax=Saccoglossus kowalevskii TaxID=10224 RepID=A0ABM0GW16_SACKO|nr:PREDICTED: centromere protein W-like [Saccoglossus kowalevskii]
MKTLKRKFPRTTVRTSMRKMMSEKAGAPIHLNKNVELLTYLMYMKFIQRLAEKTDEVARENKETVITEEHVNKVMKGVLKSCQG